MQFSHDRGFIILKDLHAHDLPITQDTLLCHNLRGSLGEKGGVDIFADIPPSNPLAFARERCGEERQGPSNEWTGCKQHKFRHSPALVPTISHTERKQSVQQDARQAVGHLIVDSGRAAGDVNRTTVCRCSQQSSSAASSCATPRGCGSDWCLGRTSFDPDKRRWSRGKHVGRKFLTYSAISKPFLTDRTICVCVSVLCVSEILNSTAVLG